MGKEAKLAFKQLNGVVGEMLTTEDVAIPLCVKPQTVRAGLCRKGNYLGMRPAVKLPNGRLLWDSGQLQSILAGELVK